MNVQPKQTRCHCHIWASLNPLTWRLCWNIFSQIRVLGGTLVFVDWQQEYQIAGQRSHAGSTLAQLPRQPRCLDKGCNEVRRDALDAQAQLLAGLQFHVRRRSHMALYVIDESTPWAPLRQGFGAAGPGLFSSVSRLQKPLALLRLLLKRATFRSLASTLTLCATWFLSRQMWGSCKNLLSSL